MATGSIRLGSSFLTLLFRRLTGQQVSGTALVVL